MALVDCTILVDASQVVISTGSSQTIHVSPVTTTIQVEGLAGIRGPQGPKGDPGDIAEYPSFEAGEALSAKRVVQVINEKAYYCDGNTAAHAGKGIGLTTGASAQGDTVTIQTSTMLTEATWTLSEGPVYVGANGALTQSVTGLAFVQQIGIAVSPTQININPQLAILH